MLRRRGLPFSLFLWLPRTPRQTYTLQLEDSLAYALQEGLRFGL